MANAGILLVKLASVFTISIILIPFPAVSSVSESEALLKFKQSLKNSEGLGSWSPGTSPCNGEIKWEGVVCFGRIVTGLRLGGMGLSGQIDVEALAMLPGIRTVSFVNNSFSGPMPEINRLGMVKSVYLSGNKFSGDIPTDFFVKMLSLKKVWLSENQFQGDIPLSLTKLPHLMELGLENNRFTGKIPSFEQPTLVYINVSNNDLEGEIPESLGRFNHTSFSRNTRLCGEKMGNVCHKPSAADFRVPNFEKQDTVIGTGVMTVAIVLLSLVVLGIVMVKRREDKRFDILGNDKFNVDLARKTSEPEYSSYTDTKKAPGWGRRSWTLSRSGGGKTGSSDTMGGGLVIVNEKNGRLFGMMDLMKAASEVLGNGGNGMSYKATMANGVTVVVKRTRDTNRVAKLMFDVEMRKLGSLRHPNILPPIGYHYRRDEKLFVYEYVPEGSLLYELHGDRRTAHSGLNWPTRLKIIEGIARGLSFLHSQLQQSELPHGNLKSSNVLLSPNYEPLLTEFGLNSLISAPEGSHCLFAYKTPEAYLSNHVSPKSDVYCFGIVILEIVTGKFPSQYLATGGGGIDIVQWGNSAILEGREYEMLDPEIVTSASRISMEKMLRIGVDCTEKDRQTRLSLDEVVRRIEEVRVDDDGSEQVHDCQRIQVLPSLQDSLS